ncbi:unnamed protein product [Dracunculus medinensis]|uniref:PHD-type domain-containing protein n=1 Tax=Dracunculus medinensis TaxID=318479 RepID=A0A0N4UEY7_DRAME|nr:unnamed protein product [Dracunculus medinensis]
MNEEPGNNVAAVDDITDVHSPLDEYSNLHNEKSTLPNKSGNSQERAMQELYKDPSFAVVCSFFNKFGSLLGMKPIYFSKLGEMFTNFHDTGRIDRELIDLHLTLLRKLNFKSARVNGWEKYLTKFCLVVPSLESEMLQLERYGYLNTPVSTKLAILRTLCESQFDYNLKFKENIVNSSSANDLRLLPVGVDGDGLEYWYQQDADLNVRIYCEEQDDQSGGSWVLVASSKEEFEFLIEKLKSNCSEEERKKIGINLETYIAYKSDSTKSSKINPQFSNKRGTFLDTFRSEFTALKTINNEKEIKRETPKQKEKIQEVSEEKFDISDSDFIYKDSEFVERRILPRRSARNAAISHLKELTGAKNKSNNKNDHINSKHSSNPGSKKMKENESCFKGNDGDEDIDEEEIKDDFFVSDEISESNSSSDDEFKPLSEIKKACKSQKQRSISNKKKTDGDEGIDDVDESDSESDRDAAKQRRKATEETKCMKCHKSSNPEVLLLCDMCDDAWHIWCLRPMLWFVPDGDWFCPKCHHFLLVEKFSFVLLELNDQLKSKAADDRK